MHFERMLIYAKQIKSRESAHSGKCHIPLPKVKPLREIHPRRIHTHPLALVHCDSPSQSKRNLSYLRANFTVLFHCPIHRRNNNIPSILGFNNRVSTKFFVARHLTKSAIHKAFFWIIFGTHHHSTYFEF